MQQKEKQRWYLMRWGIPWIVLILSLAACASSESNDSSSNNNDVPVASLQPGETLVLGETRKLSENGIYLLPEGAVAITTRCTGDVTLRLATEPPQTNTCDSLDGSQSMTNVVTGLSEVTYTFGEDAFAHVTVN